MYQSELHQILRKTLEEIKWTRSTKDEDNFRHVICSSLYKFISPSNVEIPSTRSGHGDIKIFGRRIELKYANKNKTVKIENVLEDFDCLLQDKIEFSIVAIRVDVSDDRQGVSNNYVHPTISLTKIAKEGTKPESLKHTIPDSTQSINYNGVSIFLAATFPHELKDLSKNEKASSPSKQQGNRSTVYLSFESAHAISRSSFLETPLGLIHVDVIGCKEDGLIIFLYKKVKKDSYQVRSVPRTDFNIQIPYKPQDFTIATGELVDIFSIKQKFVHKTNLNEKDILEKEVLYFKIY